MARSAFQAYITNPDDGGVLDGAQLSVTYEAGGTATIYEQQEGGTTKANPFTIGSDGKAVFYAEPGLYRITATQGGITSEFRNYRIGVFSNELNDITSLADIVTTGLVDKQQFKRGEFWPDTGVGGVDLVWDPDEPVANHNGGTIIDPAKISELNTTTKTFGTYFTPDTVSGNTGCFVVGGIKKIDPAIFGCLPEFGFFINEPTQEALNAARDSDTAKTVRFGEGVWEFGNSGTTVLNIPDGVTLEGAGRFLTTLRKDDSTSNFLVMPARSDVTIQNMTVISTGGAAGHLISGDTLTDVVIRDMELIDSAAYGIGLQGDGAFVNILIENINIVNPANDGIDIKNRANSNKNIVIRSVRVSSFAELLNNKAGIDIRGPCQLYDITVTDFGVAGNAHDAIRFRPGEIADPNGFGGHDSILDGFRVEARPSTGSTTGVKMEGRNCSISNGQISDCNIDFAVYQEGCSIGTVQCRRGNECIITRDVGHQTPGRRTSVSGLTAFNKASDFIDIETENNVFSSFIAHQVGGDALKVTSGNNNKFVCGSISGSVGGSVIVDGATFTRVVAVAGVADQ